MTRRECEPADGVRGGWRHTWPHVGCPFEALFAGPEEHAVAATDPALDPVADMVDRIERKIAQARADGDPRLR